MKVKVKWIKNTAWIVGVFLLMIIIRACFIEIYSITSGSMENTLLTGDKIIVNKSVYGTRMPSSLYEFQGLQQERNAEKRRYSEPVQPIAGLQKKTKQIL
jgi:signal peptidase I